MKKKCYILMNADGLEQKASEASAKDILNVVQNICAVELIKLSRNKWVEQIEALDNNSICFLTTHGDFGERHASLSERSSRYSCPFVTIVTDERSERRSMY